MSQERADALCGFRREDVLELAGLLGDLFFVVNMKGLRKKPFGQAMPADDVFRALAAFLSEDDHVIAVAGVLAGRAERHMAAVEHLLVRVRRLVKKIEYVEFGFGLDGTSPFPSLAGALPLMDDRVLG